MTSHFIKIKKRHDIQCRGVCRRGMTLIEVMIYVFLLSMLITGYIQYVWSVHFDDVRLNDDIDDAYVSEN